MTKKISRYNSGDVTNYIYSSENQLRKIQIFASGALKTEATYYYDGLGRRVQKQVLDAPTNASKVRSFGYDGYELLFEYNIQNQVLARYTHGQVGGDDLLSIDVTELGAQGEITRNGVSAQTFHFLKDGTNSIIDILDQSGSRIQHAVYSAFGERIQITDGVGNDITSNPILNLVFGFAGREHDSEAGLIYMNARYYDPSLGRFLQQDPNPGKLVLPSSVVNSYIYALNNPISFIDPTGQSIFDSIADFFKSIGNAINEVWNWIRSAGQTIGDFLRSGWVGKAILTTLLVAAAALTGGAAGAILAGYMTSGGVYGAVAGAIAGALVGGLVAGAISAWLGDGFWKGFEVGAIAGGLAGAMAGYGISPGGRVPAGDGASIFDYALAHTICKTALIVLTIAAVVGVGTGVAAAAAGATASSAAAAGAGASSSTAAAGGGSLLGAGVILIASLKWGGKLVDYCTFKLAGMKQ